MKPHGLYNLSWQHSGGSNRIPRVGLLRERTGVPLFLLYIEGSQEKRHLTLSSVEEVESEIFKAEGAMNKQAWLGVLSFFEAEGQSAHVVTLPLTESPCNGELALISMLGDERGYRARSGIHSIKDFVAVADLIVVPQASSLLPLAEYQRFYKELFLMVSASHHFFLIADLPKTVLPRTFAEWKWNCADAAVYYPWLIRDGRTIPPSGVAAAAFQNNDSKHHINDIPANRPMCLPHDYDPLYRHEPAELKSILDLRLNLFHSFSERDLRIWGGRTLADPSDFDSRFISTRRTLLAIQEAIQELCEPFVLEPLHQDLPKIIDVALQSSFQPHRKAFDANRKNPFQTEVKLVTVGGEDVIEVNVKCFIPFALDEIAFQMAIS